MQWIYLDGHPSTYQPPPTGLNFGEQTEQVFTFGDSRAPYGLVKEITEKTGRSEPDRNTIKGEWKITVICDYVFKNEGVFGN